MAQPPVSDEILTAALEGLELRRKRIDEQLAELRARLGQRGPGRPASTGANASGKPAKVAGQKRKLSAEARARIAEAQKRRWATYRNEKS